MKKEITIKDKAYEVRDVFSALLEFEETTGKIHAETLKDQVRMMHLNLKRANKGSFEITFEEFVDLIDEDMTLYTKLADLFSGKKDKKK